MKLEEKTKKKDEQGLIIKKYQQYLKLEKSLSKNTLEAYLTDLEKLLSFLSAEGVEILEVSLTDLQRFAAGLHDIGIHARSQARIISGIKSFFHFLIIADYIEADPSELLEGPKIGFKLPEVLTVEEIDRIISTIDLSKNEGQRNRAILETLYSCGLRVSELTGLPPIARTSTLIISWHVCISNWGSMRKQLMPMRNCKLRMRIILSYTVRLAIAILEWNNILLLRPLIFRRIT